MAYGIKFDVQKFDGKINFLLWKSKIEDLLVQQDLDSVLEENKPDKMKDEEWNSMQKKVVSSIRLVLTDEIRSDVLKEKTVKELMDKLQNIYETRAIANRLCLKMELYSLKMEEGTAIQDHINKFNELVVRLQSYEENIEQRMGEEERALLLLSSLPESYMTLRQTIISGKTTLKFDDVMAILRGNDRMTEKESLSGGEQELASEDSDFESSQPRENLHRHGRVESLSQHISAPLQSAQSKYAKVWEGNLAGPRQGQPVFISRLEGYRSASASET